MQSRYYIAKRGRFVNADGVSYYFIYNRVDNCYTYCNCCPIMYMDEDGCFGRIYDLGQGWHYRIDLPRAGDVTKRHIHVWKEGGPSYSQNADGTPHDGLEGTPPKWVREKLRQLKKWDWKDEPSTDPLPQPTLTPSPAPTPSPQHTPEPLSTNSEQQDIQNSYSIDLGTIGGIAVIVGILWWGVKISFAPTTGGLSLALP